MGLALVGTIALSTVAAQWRILRRHSRRAGWWPAIGILGWAAGILAASIGGAGLIWILRAGAPAAVRTTESRPL